MVTYYAEVANLHNVALVILSSPIENVQLQARSTSTITQSVHFPNRQPAILHSSAPSLRQHGTRN